MRNYDDRIAQIYLRGEALIRKRKKQRRGILLGSISAVLCFMLFAAPFLPSRTPSGEAPEIGFEMMGSSSGTAAPSVWVESKLTNTSYSVHEEAKSVAELLESITTVYEMAGAVVDKGDPAVPTGEPDGAVTATGKEEADDITIKVVLTNGTVRRYLLLDTALQDAQTGKAYPMTAQQAQQLRQLLGIQEEKP